MAKLSSPSTILCPGSFDPPTNGHINIVERGLKMCDRVVVAVAINRSKKTIFEPEERVEMLKDLLKDKKNVEIDSFEGLLVDYCRKKGIHTILRGIRTVSDYEYELQMSLANRILNPDIETVFMMTEGRFAHISSSIIKEVISFGGSGAGMIHPVVEKKLKEKFRKQK
ncbi:MAG: pantetheine-phosphate adenylyltransferase [Deltaproteobacteria bacterium]|nr:pantetheine-phosphate adenylyltransferase [Deltaproteobacteria bacterium]